MTEIDFQPRVNFASALHKKALRSTENRFQDESIRQLRNMPVNDASEGGNSVNALQALHTCRLLLASVCW